MSEMLNILLSGVSPRELWEQSEREARAQFLATCPRCPECGERMESCKFVKGGTGSGRACPDCASHMELDEEVYAAINAEVSHLRR